MQLLVGAKWGIVATWLQSPLGVVTTVEGQGPVLVSRPPLLTLSARRSWGPGFFAIFHCQTWRCSKRTEVAVTCLQTWGWPPICRPQGWPSVCRPQGCIPGGRIFQYQLQNRLFLLGDSIVNTYPQSLSFLSRIWRGVLHWQQPSVDSMPLPWDSLGEVPGLRAESPLFWTFLFEDWSTCLCWTNSSLVLTVIF